MYPLPTDNLIAVVGSCQFWTASIVIDLTSDRAIDSLSCKTCHQLSCGEEASKWQKEGCYWKQDDNRQCGQFVVVVASPWKVKNRVERSITMTSCTQIGHQCSLNLPNQRTSSNQRPTTTPRLIFIPVEEDQRKLIASWPESIQLCHDYSSLVSQSEMRMPP